MKYSVLMSVYKNDDPALLKIALQSIYEDQTVKPDEIVVVFDGPLTDGLYDVLKIFAEDKQDIVKYLPQEVNKGLGEALRVGSLACTGDYIFRMDSDDISLPTRFEKQIAYLTEHPEIDVLGTDIAEFDVDVDEKKRIRQCPKDHNGIVEMGKSRNPMNHVSVCMKKTALYECGNYEEVALLEDYFLWLKMIVAGKTLANYNEPLVYVRRGNDFAKKRSSKKRVSGWKVLQDYMLQHHLIDKKQAKRNMLYIYGFTYMPNCFRKFVYERVLRK